MNDAIQTPEAQKLAQMLQQQQMQKILQGIQGGMGSGAMSSPDMEMAQRAMSTQPDYGMNANAAPMQQGNAMQPSVQMLGRPVTQGSYGGKPMSNMGQMQSDYEMMRKR